MEPERIAAIMTAKKWDAKTLAWNIKASHQSVLNWLSGRNKPMQVWVEKLERLERRIQK